MLNVPVISLRAVQNSGYGNAEWNLKYFNVKCRFKAGNSCYYSVQTLLSSRLFSKNLKIKINKTIILPVVPYGCETWSLTLREECRLRIFENRNLRRIFEPKRDENGDWKRLHNEELHSFYRSPNKVRVIRSIILKYIKQ